MLKVEIENTYQSIVILKSFYKKLEVREEQRKRE